MQQFLRYEQETVTAFIELTMDALLKAIWFKGSLRSFLLQHKIKESALAQWHADQTKRDFIQWLWPQLFKDEKGQNVILSMARSLAEIEHTFLILNERKHQRPHPRGC